MTFTNKKAREVININIYICVVIVTSLLKSVQYSKQSNNIKTGKEMKLDVDTQSFMQNTFTIFSLT